MSSKLQVRVVSQWFRELETEDAFFSVHLPSEKADALLCDWAPSDELSSFPRRKAWYCCEPQCQFEMLEGGTWPGIRKRLDPSEFLCHNHSDPRFRVPHVTHFENLEISIGGERVNRAISIVSNFGGSPWRRRGDLNYRNRFVTHPSVDLYGRAGWKRYRARWFSRPQPPANYRGELPGDWPDSDKRDLVARYKVAVCLENMNEAYYFTEKFVEAVCAGCVPIYRADPTVRDTILKDAKWIDPADYGHDPQGTILAALRANVREFQEVNARWLNTGTMAETHYEAVFRKIARILTSEGPS